MKFTATRRSRESLRQHQATPKPQEHAGFKQGQPIRRTLCTVCRAHLSLLFDQADERKNQLQKYTLQGLQDEIDLIKCFDDPGKALYFGEILQMQR